MVLNNNLDALDMAETGGGFSGIPGYESLMMSGKGMMAALRDALAKSLSAGTETNLPNMTGGGAFRVESLETDLKLLVEEEKSFTLFNDLLGSKKKAKSTVEQYTSMDSYGEAFTFEEGGAPSQEDDQYKRHVVPIKYVGAIGQITNPMNYVESIVDPIAQETRAKNLAIIRKGNQLSYRGNSSFSATEFDGILFSVLKSSYATSNVIDLKGKRPTLEAFNEAMNAIEQQKGYATNPRAYMSPSARKNYKNELQRQKFMVVNGVPSVNDDAEGAIQGLKANQVVYDGGEMPLKKDISLEPEKCPRLNSTGDAFISTGSTPPNAPTITSVTPTADVNSTLPSGTYDYAVVAINKYGHKSTPTETTNVVIGDGQKAVFVLADGGGAAAGQEATAFAIYRRAAGGASTDYRYMFTFSTTDTKVDDGSWIPGTSIIPVVDFDTREVLSYHQLLDIAKFPLATSVDGIKWMQRMYGALLVYNPRRIAIIKNAGSEPGA